MVKFFYNSQSFIDRLNIALLKKIMYRVHLILIRVIAPIYYKMTPLKQSGISSSIQTQKNPKIIVSLTSFPPRMNQIWMVLESLMRQTQKPDKIILWLASSQFPTLEAVDNRVRNMQTRGLEIRFCDDLKSHKKYFYAMQEYNNDIIITADDDLFYPEYMVERLLSVHKEYPDCITCFRAHKMTLHNGKVNKYANWIHGSKNHVGPDHLLMATNGGGTLYPPNCLNKEAFNIRAIKETCLNSDDIWLKCMSYLNGTKTVKVHAVFSEMFSTRGSSNSGLAKSNVINGENDTQLQNLIEKYGVNFSSLNE